MDVRIAFLQKWSLALSSVWFVGSTKWPLNVMSQYNTDSLPVTLILVALKTAISKLCCHLAVRPPDLPLRTRSSVTQRVEKFNCRSNHSFDTVYWYCLIVHAKMSALTHLHVFPNLYDLSHTGLEQSEEIEYSAVYLTNKLHTRRYLEQCYSCFCLHNECHWVQNNVGSHRRSLYAQKKKKRKKVIQVWNHMKEEKKVQVYLTNKLVYIATWPTL